MESHRNVTRTVIVVAVPRRFDRRGQPRDFRDVAVPPGSIFSHGTVAQGGAYLTGVCGSIVGFEHVEDPGGNVDP